MMNLFLFMFASPYDQASLAVMVVGLLGNAVADMRRHKSTAA